MGFEVEAGHHEVAPGQHEIDFRYAEALETADNLATFRFVVRNVAYRHGFLATFMPKPIFGQNGSGMHTHQSLFRKGANAFHDPKGKWELSDTALAYIAGLLDGRDELGCLTLASAIGASCVRAIGTTAGVFTRPEADAFLAANRLAVEPI